MDLSSVLSIVTSYHFPQCLLSTSVFPFLLSSMFCSLWKGSSFLFILRLRSSKSCNLLAEDLRSSSSLAWASPLRRRPVARPEKRLPSLRSNLCSPCHGQVLFLEKRSCQTSQKSRNKGQHRATLLSSPAPHVSVATPAKCTRLLGLTFLLMWKELLKPLKCVNPSH